MDQLTECIEYDLEFHIVFSHIEISEKCVKFTFGLPSAISKCHRTRIKWIALLVLILFLSILIREVLVTNIAGLELTKYYSTTITSKSAMTLWQVFSPKSTKLLLVIAIVGVRSLNCQVRECAFDLQVQFRIILLLKETTLLAKVIA